MMKKNVFCITVIFFVLALVFSCSQDPVFYTISNETVPVKPRIQGGPTNMVVFKRGTVPVMYVASGSLHWYAKAGAGAGNPGWDSNEYRIPQPGGKVIGLAATDKHLYALCIIGSGVTTILQRIGPDENNWEPVSLDPKVVIQSIFADKERLFAGAMNNGNSHYGILYLADNLSTPALLLLECNTDNTEMLSGAASLNQVHYLSTRGKGIYMIGDNELANIPAQRLDEVGNPDGKNRLFMGMIQLEDGSILVIERDGGAFFEVQESGFKKIMYKKNKPEDSDVTVASGKYSTGALALWQQVIFDENNVPHYNENNKMLIAGIQGGLYSSTTTTTSYTHGYVEFDLNFKKEGGWLVLDSPRRDNTPTITVSNKTDRYKATIGKHPINHLFQAPRDVDDNMTFFASTQTAGLWSYRERTEGLQWNAEGENEP